MKDLIIHTWLWTITAWQVGGYKEIIYKVWGVRFKMSWIVYLPIMNVIVLYAISLHVFGLVKDNERL